MITANNPPFVSIFLKSKVICKRKQWFPSRSYNLSKVLHLESNFQYLPFLNIWHVSDTKSVKTSLNIVLLAGNYMFKVNNRNTRTRCEICSKLTIKISLLLTLIIFHSLLNVSIVNFEQVNASWDIMGIRHFPSLLKAITNNFLIIIFHGVTENQCWQTFKGRLTQMWKSANIFIFTWKQYVEDFTIKNLLLFGTCASEICEKFFW